MEYAARVGTSNPGFAAKYLDERSSVGSRRNVSPVKTKKANPWGLYDVLCGACTAVSDWKAGNRPDKQVDPQGEPFESKRIYGDKSLQTAQKPVKDMIMTRAGIPAVHKAFCGFSTHDRYSEDGLDGGNGAHWVGIFRVVVEAEPAAAAPAAEPRPKSAVR
jgi:hypothetical protein